MERVERLDPRDRVRPLCSAVHWCRGEIPAYVLRDERPVRFATTQEKSKLFFNLRRVKKNLGWLNDGETRAIAEDLGVTAKEVTDMEQRLSSRDLSFDPAPDADDEDGAYSPSAYLQHPEADPSVAVEREQWDEDTAERLSQALETLDERSQHILRSRWMTEDKATLHELADKYGVSAERIRQIEANAIKKLRGIVAEPIEA